MLDGADNSTHILMGKFPGGRLPTPASSHTKRAPLRRHGVSIPSAKALVGCVSAPL